MVISTSQTTGDRATLTAVVRLDLRQTLAFALWAAAGASFAVALLDYLAYSFAFRDLFEYERRLHSPSWSTDGWRPAVDWILAGRVMLLCAGLGMVAAVGAFALARIRRTSRALLVLAGACAASVVAITCATAWRFRGRVLEWFGAFEPDTATMWFARGELGSFDRAEAGAIEETGASLSAVLIGTAAIAWVRVATRRGWPLARASSAAAAVALPLVIASGTLAALWRDFGSFGRADHEQYVALVETARFIIGATALAVAAAASLLRGRPTRLAPAVCIFAVGLAAFMATAPHRRTIDTVYPLYDAGAAPVRFKRLPAPWSFITRAAGTCVDVSRIDYHTALVRLGDDGEITLTVNGVVISPPGDEIPDALRGREDRPDLYLARYLLLLVERRVPVAAVAPLLERVATTPIEAVVVGGLATRTLPSGDGPMIVWDVCAIGEIPPAELGRVRSAPAATWGELVDDREYVRPIENR